MAPAFPDHAGNSNARAEFQEPDETDWTDTDTCQSAFFAGLLAAEHAARLNPARKQLEDLIKKAISENAANFEDLCKASGKKAGEVPPIIAAAGIPGSEALFYQDLPIFSQAKSYTEILQIIRDLCAKVDDEAITKARQDGLQNARTYMSMRDLDVYVATSMRDPLHFTTNWDFVNGLFHRGALAEWSIRYFDPTQSFLEDRVQKGLLEYLMIKRARLCVYNAQESDTFGKDAEAGVTLAQGKPVVVYVARLFPSIDRLKSVYEAIDEGTRHGRDAFLDLLRKSALLSEDQIGILRDPDKTTPDAINELLRKHVPAVLEKLSADVIEMELIRQGYDPTGPADPKDLALSKITLLERRALTFRNIHPLSLQASPIDGVSRGVIVTRSVEDTANVIRGIFLGTLEYDIVGDPENWLLVDRLTRSPVRVVTKDSVLTTAFWSEEWHQKS